MKHEERAHALLFLLTRPLRDVTISDLLDPAFFILISTLTPLAGRDHVLL